MFCTVAPGCSPRNGCLPVVSEVEQNAEREQIRACVDGMPAHLLGRHVREFALDFASFGQAGRLAGGLGDAEVDQLCRARERDEHVLRRHIAVHQPE